MKKILQRIGLLAMAVMLLWGWQGMNAKAADNIFTFECNYSSPIDKTKLKVVQEGNNYHFDIYPADGYAFTQAPTASLVDYTADTRKDFTVKKGSDDTYYRCSIDNVSLDSNHKYSISIIVNGEIEITKIRITPTAPVIGQVLPSQWNINTTDVREKPLVWMSDGQYVTDSVAEPNKTYFANITLSAETDYKFSDDVAIVPSNYVNRNRNDNGSITFVYGFKTIDAQPSNPGNTNTEITWEKWNDWTINRDKLENGRIAKGYGLSGSAAESHDAHLFLYVEPKDGYYFTEEPKVSWNDTLLVPLPKDSSTLYGYKYQLDDNGKGTIFVEGKAVKKDTAEPQANEPQANTSQSSNDTYKIINGARSTWNGSTTEGLTIRGDGDFDKFAGVRVDGNWIPSVHYEAKSGSTIVTLKPSYLASLSEGEHTVDIMWIDDSASTTFTVAANTAAAQPELDSVPKTGEGVMGWMPEILLLAAAGLVTFGGILRRRSKIHL